MHLQDFASKLDTSFRISTTIIDDKSVHACKCWRRS